MKTLVLTPLSLALLLSGCASERIVERPVPVPVETVKYIPVPADLLVPCQKASVPQGVTYGEALALWSRDRASVDTCAARLLAIRQLRPPAPSGQPAAPEAATGAEPQ